MNIPRTIRLATFWACALLVTPALAQYQVRQPGDPPPNETPASVNSYDRPVGVELYGNNSRQTQSRYGPQTLDLPSEDRIARQRSGALPSEIRVQRNAVGPLSPHGKADYIPIASPLQIAMGVAPPVLYGPAWAARAALNFDGRVIPQPVGNEAGRQVIGADGGSRAATPVENLAPGTAPLGASANLSTGNQPLQQQPTQPLQPLSASAHQPPMDADGEAPPDAQPTPARGSGLYSRNVTPQLRAAQPIDARVYSGTALGPATPLNRTYNRPLTLIRRPPTTQGAGADPRLAPADPTTRPAEQPQSQHLAQ